VIVHRRRGVRVAGARPVVPRRAALRWLEVGLWSVALLTAAWLGFVALDRSMHARQQTRWLDELANRAAISIPEPAQRAVATTSPPAAPRRLPVRGEPIARLEIPGADLSVVVAAGTDARTLRRGVGHIDGTALPGESGNIGLAGHRDTVFRGLRKLRPDDRIFLVTAGESIEYAIESLRTVAPDRNDVLDPSPQPTLTLVTCYPFDFVGPAPLRFIVRAREVGRVDAAPREAPPSPASTPAVARRR
jgi:sortase A